MTGPTELLAKADERLGRLLTSYPTSNHVQAELTLVRELRELAVARATVALLEAQLHALR